MDEEWQYFTWKLMISFIILFSASFLSVVQECGQWHSTWKSVLIAGKVSLTLPHTTLLESAIFLWRHLSQFVLTLRERSLNSTHGGNCIPAGQEETLPMISSGSLLCLPAACPLYFSTFLFTLNATAGFSDIPSLLLWLPLSKAQFSLQPWLTESFTFLLIQTMLPSCQRMGSIGKHYNTAL